MTKYPRFGLVRFNYIQQQGEVRFERDAKVPDPVNFKDHYDPIYRKVGYRVYKTDIDPTKNIVLISIVPLRKYSGRRMKLERVLERIDEFYLGRRIFQSSWTINLYATFRELDEEYTLSKTRIRDAQPLQLED
ncbi:MAG: hypothetical protein PHF67_02790 [Candidatus Nanoarchaeia archaeon]|nr:hypothetical protein [Candidatus Nanoarchaeia archaeon]